MDFTEFTNRIIDDGIAAAKMDYRDGSIRLKGAIMGFEACRDKNVVELRALLDGAQEARRLAERQQSADYRLLRCYEAEIGWVCNVVSAALMNQKLPVIVTPTVRGFLKAAKIVGVA